eukprot:TRINITY_DN16664_c0_g1_i1.p1 TRINITY_DN16664_c0_g1~~TRINITY_DN16664_c0_g1_i1.p1  ORF type:complete len:194 (-),score=25.01 TRINITY_DN16664_c0_g1_i1:65-646(-)
MPLLPAARTVARHLHTSAPGLLREARSGHPLAPEGGFVCTVRVPVRWGDADATGAVSAATMFQYFEICRLAHLATLQSQEHKQRGWDPMRTSAGVGWILADSRAAFPEPLLTYNNSGCSVGDSGAAVSVGLRVEDVRETEYLQVFRVVEHRSQRTVAEGSSRVVHFDYSQHRRAPIPVRIADLLRDLAKAGSR